MSLHQRKPTTMGNEYHGDESSDEGQEPNILRPKSSGRRPKITIDWRHEICSFLEISNDVPDNELLDTFYEAFDTLREIDQLRKQASAQSGPPRFQIVHEVTCHHGRSEQGVFSDPPTVVNDGPHGAHARTSRRIPNMEVFLERNKEITFLIYRQYECCGTVLRHEKPQCQDDTDDLKIESLLKHEYIKIISPDLRKVMIDLGVSLEDVPFPDLSKEEAVIESPYIWWFHRRSQIQKFTEKMPSGSQDHISVFARYLEESLGKEWEVVDQLLSRKRITTHLIHYLFVPNEVIISQSAGSDVARLKGCWLRDWATTRRVRDGRNSVEVDLFASYWDYTGTFECHRLNLVLRDFPSRVGEFAITDLPIYPQRFASSEAVQALRERGRMFWKCRERHYVQSITQSRDGLQETVQSRFMVDAKTYNEMHPSQRSLPGSYDKDADRRVAAMMSEDDPGFDDTFFMCLPTRIIGFNMQRKEWVKLKVATIQDVEWDKNAFQLLVLEQGTKDLVEAVVTNRISAGKQTDVIQGKGNGLFLLLHGGPGTGTGKTLTAESVAEIAKRPLYRVTCGDIGTKADEVEKYLESVLMLGKVWECVVLLDEADVFLEQRQLQQLERNALVSVFLRVLEYYDGILILTSNRVGTFDEAFKSRIQLSLRYSNLSMNQRRKIWENFIGRLEILSRLTNRDPDVWVNAPGTRRGIDVGIDTTGIRKHLDELARHELNGREIRNAISTARQLAMFRGVPMSYEHLDTVIIEANKFQNYIKDLNQGFTADQLSNDRGER